MEGLTALFSVSSVTRWVATARWPVDTSGATMPPQHEDKDPCFCGLCFLFFSCREHLFMYARLCHIRCTKNAERSIRVCVLTEEVWNLTESRIHSLHCLIHTTHTHALSCRICCYATRLPTDFCTERIRGIGKEETEIVGGIEERRKEKAR